MRYHVKERALSLKDDFVVRNDAGDVVFNVSGKLFRIVDSFSVRDRNTGEELVQVKQRFFAHTKQYEIFAKDGEALATLRKKPEVGPRGERFEITTRDGMAMYIQGDFHEWDFRVIDHYGRLLGNISREWSLPFFGDSYTVDVAPGIDGPFFVTLAIILDEIREDDGKE